MYNVTMLASDPTWHMVTHASLDFTRKLTQMMVESQLAHTPRFNKCPAVRSGMHVHFMFSKLVLLLIKQPSIF